MWLNLQLINCLASWIAVTILQGVSGSVFMLYDANLMVLLVANNMAVIVGM